jgi:hypothetical protein
MLSKELTSELQKILKKDYGKDIPILEVKQFGNALVCYNNLLTEMNKSNYKHFCRQPIEKNAIV